MNGKAIRDYAEIYRHLPTPVRSVMDIGCGSGHLMWLMAHEQIKLKDIHLLDGDGPSAEKVMGYNRVAVKPWKDVHLAAKKLELTKPNVHVLHPSFNTFPVCDLYISFKSWGFHYPLEEYWDRVLAVMPRGAMLMIDLRKNVDVSRRMNKYFKAVAIDIGRDRKCERTIWLRK